MDPDAKSRMLPRSYLAHDPEASSLLRVQALSSLRLGRHSYGGNADLGVALILEVLEKEHDELLNCIVTWGIATGVDALPVRERRGG